MNGIGDAAKEAQEVRMNPFWATIDGPGFFLSMPQGSEEGQTSEGQGSESDDSDEAAP